MAILPPYLKAGDTIGITCPAGYMPREKAEACITQLQQWGFKTIIGKTLGSASENYFSGSDEERKDELQRMLDDRNIDAILFGRGGYGMSRIIDELSFRKFKKRPKWLIGFSDITVIQSHLLSNYKIASIHGPMAAAFNNVESDNIYIQSLYDALTGKKAEYEITSHHLNKTGKATGQVIGGNLALLAHVTGTVSDFNSKNKIFFLEDIGEYIYNADRMLVQLKRSGKFKKPAAVIFGGFTDMKDTERPFGKDIVDVLKDLADTLNCPVCFNFPVSHGDENLAIKIGAKYELSISEEKVLLREK